MSQRNMGSGVGSRNSRPESRPAPAGSGALCRSGSAPKACRRGTDRHAVRVACRRARHDRRQAGVPRQAQASLEAHSPAVRLDVGCTPCLKQISRRIRAPGRCVLARRTHDRRPGGIAPSPTGDRRARDGRSSRSADLIGPFDSPAGSLSAHRHKRQPVGTEAAAHGQWSGISGGGRHLARAGRRARPSRSPLHNRRSLRDSPCPASSRCGSCPGYRSGPQRWAGPRPFSAWDSLAVRQIRIVLTARNLRALECAYPFEPTGGLVQ